MQRLSCRALGAQVLPPDIERLGADLAIGCSHLVGTGRKNRVGTMVHVTKWRRLPNDVQFYDLLFDQLQLPPLAALCGHEASPSLRAARSRSARSASVNCLLVMCTPESPARRVPLLTAPRRSARQCLSHRRAPARRPLPTPVDPALPPGRRAAAATYTGNTGDVKMSRHRCEPRLPTWRKGAGPTPLERSRTVTTGSPAVWTACAPALGRGRGTWFKTG
jgi:hypothetical protein